MKILKITKSNDKGSLIGYLVVREEADKEEIDYLVDEWCNRDTSLGISMAFAFSYKEVESSEEIIQSIEKEIASTSIEITRLILLRSELHDYRNKLKTEI